MDDRYFNNEDSERRISDLGHRGFVGGDSTEMWYSIGILQFHFLVLQGLVSHHRLLDIGCGALRAAQFTIPYLDKGNYFGIDAEPTLIEAGLKYEIPEQLVELKRPTFMVSHKFEFDFCEAFDYAIAQSVFTHLTTEDILTCLEKLRPLAHAGSKVFFTFFEGDSAQNGGGPSHANICWHYPRTELEMIALDAGWKPSYIGTWGHPRGQMMMLLTPG